MGPVRFSSDRGSWSRMKFGGSSPLASWRMMLARYRKLTSGMEVLYLRASINLAITVLMMQDRSLSLMKALLQ